VNGCDHFASHLIVLYIRPGGVYNNIITAANEYHWKISFNMLARNSPLRSMRIHGEREIEWWRQSEIHRQRKEEIWYSERTPMVRAYIHHIYIYIYIYTCPVSTRLYVRCSNTRKRWKSRKNVYLLYIYARVYPLRRCPSFQPALVMSILYYRTFNNLGH